MTNYSIINNLVYITLILIDQIPEKCLLVQKAVLNLILIYTATLKKTVSVQSLSHVQLFETPLTAAYQASLFITNSQNLLKFMSIQSLMPSNQLILCCPLSLLTSIFPSIWVFPVIEFLASDGQNIGVSALASNEFLGMISFRIDWLYLLAVQGTLKNPL